MDTFLHKIHGLVSAGETGLAIRAFESLLHRFVLSDGNELLLNEFWEEVAALAMRWRRLSKSHANGSVDPLELGRVNFLVIQLARTIALHPSTARRANDGFHYASHLGGYLQGFLGKTVGGYELVEFVGMGGFGTVFKGRHGYTKRISAVKVSHPLADGERVIDDLLAVSLPALQHLDHPYIARLLDAGEVNFDGHRRIYVVTEFVAGGTLREFCLAADKSSPDRIRSALQIAIPAGADFRRCLSDAVSNCDVLLAIIGPGWAVEMTRLHDSGDFIRIELETALSCDCLVIPVLLDNAQMPAAEKLPETMSLLVYRNAVSVDHGKDYHAHMEVLFRAIGAARQQQPTAE